MDDPTLTKEPGTNTEEKKMQGGRKSKADVRVHAILDDKLEDKIVFALAGKVEPPGNGWVKGHVIKIKAGEPAEIEFKLKIQDDEDLKDYQLKFSQDPIWIARGADCPKNKCMVDFEVVDIKDDKLEIKKAAGPQQDYAFTLRFVDKDKKPHDYDPIIKN